MKVLIVFGTRPEAIKMAPVVQALEKMLEVVVCVTGQHREMLDQVLELFEIEPNYDLNIMKSGQDLFDVTSNVLLDLRSVLQEEQPDLVLVHGDTTTAMTAALASFYMQIPVGHVEAGLRTYDIHSPFPEELNRQMIDKIAAYHFAPTQQACKNLLDEHVAEENILVTGNTVIDALLSVIEKARAATFSDELLGRLSFLLMDELPRIVLVTGHRRRASAEGLKRSVRRSSS